MGAVLVLADDPVVEKLEHCIQREDVTGEYGVAFHIGAAPDIAGQVLCPIRVDGPEHSLDVWLLGGPVRVRMGEVYPHLLGRAEEHVAPVVGTVVGHDALGLDEGHGRFVPGSFLFSQELVLGVVVDDKLTNLVPFGTVLTRGHRLDEQTGLVNAFGSGEAEGEPDDAARGDVHHQGQEHSPVLRLALLISADEDHQVEGVGVDLHFLTRGRSNVLAVGGVLAEGRSFPLPGCGLCHPLVLYADVAVQARVGRYRCALAVGPLDFGFDVRDGSGDGAGGLVRVLLQDVIDGGHDFFTDLREERVGALDPTIDYPFGAVLGVPTQFPVNGCGRGFDAGRDEFFNL